MKKILFRLCIIISLTIIPLLSFSQLDSSWHHLDPEKDNVLGISTKRAYEYLKNRKPDTVIVAVIDNGAELTHDDLKEVFWINKGEIKDNGIDDEKNGYIDDIHGWNFLGNANGKNLKRETIGLTRMYSHLNKKYRKKDLKDIEQSDVEEYKKYQLIKKEYKEKIKKKNEDIAFYKQILSNYLDVDKILRKHLKKSDYYDKDVRQIKKAKNNVLLAKEYWLKLYDNGFTKKSLETRIKNLKKDLETRLNPKYKNREEIVGDKPDDLTDTNYGNNMVNARSPYHGTGVAGVVGAVNNDFGIDGVAKHVKLMILRVVPNGDERDKDVALAIKYAVRNGADIINCSFAKKHSLHPDFVVEAIKEAERKGVLIIVAAGNSGTNNDEIPYYPNGLLEKNIKADNYLTVGASLPDDNEKLVAFFSNYGKKTVDVFAPGYMIKNCATGNKYDMGSGTSIAAPVVAGMAAVLKSYFPHLKAKALKEIILRSVYIPQTKKVILPGDKADTRGDFSNLSVSGGIVNLYKAVLLVEKDY